MCGILQAGEPAKSFFNVRDFGALGEDGRGHIGMQKMLGQVDIVMGSFSKTFASNGGFVATKSRHVQEYLRYFSAPGGPKGQSMNFSAVNTGRPT